MPKFKSQLIDAQLESRGSSPTKRGEIVLNTSNSNQVEYHDGSNNRVVANTDQAQTFTNKTHTDPVIDGSVSGTGIQDDDAFSSAAADKLATSESIKAYVDNGDSDKVDKISSFDNVVPRFDGIGGDLQSSNVTIDDSDNLTLGNNSSMRLRGSTGANYLGFKAPSTVSSNTTFTLPDGDGASGQYLTTNGSGVLSWTTDGRGLTYEAKTADFTAAINRLYSVAPGAGNVTATLPTAVDIAGEVISFYISSDIGELIIDGDSSETINGESTLTLFMPGETVTLRSDGANWQIINKYSPVVKVVGAGNGGTSLTANVTNIDFTETDDTHDAFNGTQFTSPKDSNYIINGMLFFTGGVTLGVNSYINSVFFRTVSVTQASTQFVPFRWQGYLAKDEILSFRVDTGATLSNSGTGHWIEIISI